MRKLIVLTLAMGGFALSSAGAIACPMMDGKSASQQTVMTETTTPQTPQTPMPDTKTGG